MMEDEKAMDALRILVTGAAGYLGHHVSLLLREVAGPVVLMDAFPLGQSSLQTVIDAHEHLFAADLRDESRVREMVADFRPDVCVHLAAVVGEQACERNPSRAIDVNVTATRKLIETIKEYNCRRLVFISTCSNYGIVAGRLANEDEPLNPLSLYAETKVTGERYAQAASNAHFEVVILRLSTLFGVSPRMRFDLTVNQFSAQAHYERTISLYQKETRRPYLHVSDAARVVMRFALSQQPGATVYNVGATHLNHTKAEIAEKIRCCWTDTVLKEEPGGLDRRDYAVDFSRLTGIGFRPTMNVDDGIREIEAYLRKQKEPIDYKAPQYRAG